MGTVLSKEQTVCGWLTHWAVAEAGRSRRASIRVTEPKGCMAGVIVRRSPKGKVGFLMKLSTCWETREAGPTVVIHFYNSLEWVVH